ncbi:MAG: transcription elongation factor GreA [Solirubrobacteraceae bacterium]|jgi:transcription elongation factor GreA|nr:transcription elongation factor GreA [Solirubrobacteraceae bacterium]
MSDRSYEITPDALVALEAELAELEGEARRAMAERIKTARDWGDLKENAEYHDAKDAQAHLETRILRLQDRRRHAVIVEPGPGAGGTAAIGSTVRVRDDREGAETTYELVGATESDPAAGKLSVESPLARSLIGAKVDDVVDFRVPKGTRRLRVLSVS